ncbi:MAG: PAS domain-containing protein, partial [Solirubrobacteraceae bacterium]
MSPGAEPQHSPDGSPTERLTVLVADADIARRTRLCASLRAAGLTLTEAGDDREALALARSCDVVVVDVELPPGGGLRLATELRGQRVTAGVAILERSAVDLGAAGTVRAIEAGADAYLPESIEPELLVTAVRTLAARGSAARAASDVRIRLQAGIDAVPIGVMLLDRELRVVEANRLLGRMGLTMHRPRARRLADAIPGDAGERIAELAGRVLETGVDQAARFQTVAVNGPVHWQVRAHPVSEETAGIDGVGITIEDITELERATEQLRESQRRWQAVLGSDQVGVALRDRDCRVIVCNETYARIYGAQSAAALVGTDLHAILTPEFADEATDQYHARWAGTAPSAWHFDRDYVLPNGRTVTIHAATSMVLGESGEALYQLTLLENRTEERRLADELARARRIEAIGRLAGGVAHDVNNMLAVILGYTEIVSRRLGERHELQPELGEIRRAAEHSRALAHELLAFGRRQVLEREPIAPGEVVGELGALLRRTLGARVRLVIEDDSNGAIVYGDRAQLETVVVNLVANARDAMPDGGRVTVRVGTSPAAAEAEHGLVEISVDDTGAGMPEHVRENIFEPFFT